MSYKSAKFFAWLVRRQSRKFLELKKGVPLEVFSKGNERRPLALYVHIPFCRQLCAYCSFNRYPFDESKARLYFSALKEELKLYLEKGLDFGSIYIGGGTPTVWMEGLVDFLEVVRHCLGPKDISLETNPQDVTAENLTLLKELGVKRLSMGVQSFRDEMLSAMGRFSHTGEEAFEKARLAQGYFDTFNVDILYNFPTQRLEDLLYDIEVIDSLRLDQVTFYPLMPASKKRRAIETKFSKIDHNREYEFYALILEEMAKKGYRPSTVWCFSRGTKMIDEYIIDYPEYIALGSGAVGLYRGVFYTNHFDLINYVEKVKRKELPIAMYRKLSNNELKRYFLLTQLFGTELKKGLYHKLFKKDLEEDLKLEIALLRVLKVLKPSGNGWVLTKKGMFVVSAMMREFFTGLNALREYCRGNRI